MNAINRARPWMVLAGAFIMMFTCIGLGASGLTLFYQPVAEDLGFSQTAFSLYYSISTLVGMFFMPVIGTVLSKHVKHIRLIMLICGICTMLSFVGYSFCTRLWQFYACSVFRGMITCGISAVPATMLLNNWFYSHRSMVTAIAFTGSSFGGMVYTQLSNYYITHFGWHMAYIALGVTAFATIVIAVLLVQPSPETGNSPPYVSAKEQSHKHTIQENWGISGKGALRTFSFWLLLIGIFLGGMVVMGVQQGMVSSLMIDYNYTSGMAASLYSIFMIVMCLGKLLYGWLADAAGPWVSTIYIGVLNALAMIAFLNISFSGAMAYALVVLFGLGNMTATVLMTNITTTVFGTKDYGSIYGTVNMMASGGMSVGPLLTAAIFDATGSYRMAWLIFFVIAIVSMALFLAVLAGKKQVVQHAEAEERRTKE